MTKFRENGRKIGTQSERDEWASIVRRMRKHFPEFMVPPAERKAMREERDKLKQKE